MELLILYELWAGERLTLEKAHPRSLRSGCSFCPGIDIWRSCRLIGAIMRSLCLLPGGLGRFVPCSIGAYHCTLRHIGWERVENTKLRKWSIEQGNLWERNSSNAQIRTLLEEQRQMIIAEYCEKIGHHELQEVMPKKSVDLYKDNYGDSKWIFVKFTNKVLQRWRNYENSKVLPSIRSQDGSSSRTRTLLWNYQVEYKNYKMK